MLRIMVVEDEPLTRQFLASNIPLIHDGCEVVAEAMDGREALELLADRQVDLVITDIKMPEMDGLALCGHLAERYPGVKAVILSGFDEFSFAKQAIRYGVSEYLLKPLVREELKSALHRMAERVEEERRAELSRQAVTQLSEETKKQVVRHFIKAAVTDSSTEIQALYPLLFRMKVGLIESETAVMLIAPDEESLLPKSLARPDVSLFRYIVHQVSSEIAEEAELGIVSFDAEGNTIALISGDHEAAIMEKCERLHRSVSEVLRQTSGVTVTSAVGECVQDALQLHLSYQKAQQAFNWRMAGGGEELYRYQPYSPLMKRSQTVMDALASIGSGVSDRNEMMYTLALQSYIDGLNEHELTIERATAFGIRMVRRLESHFGEASAALVETAVNRLRECRLRDVPPAERKAKTAELLTSIIRLFVDRPDVGEPDEREIVTRAKAYIYAHYAEPISLGLLADKLGVTANYLSSVFHKSVNEPYIKYLTRIRMEQAAKLLKANPDEKIYDIAEKVGYVSVKHFSHVFKQYFQMPPGEYQDKCRK